MVIESRIFSTHYNVFLSLNLYNGASGLEGRTHLQLTVSQLIHATTMTILA